MKDREQVSKRGGHKRGSQNVGADEKVIKRRAERREANRKLKKGEDLGTRERRQYRGWTL